MVRITPSYFFFHIKISLLHRLAHYEAMLVRGARGIWHHFLISQYLPLLFTISSSKSIPIPESRLDWRNMWRIVERTYNNLNMVRDSIFFLFFVILKNHHYLGSYTLTVRMLSSNNSRPAFPSNSTRVQS